MFDVFISYAHEDAELVAALASGLGRIGKPWWRRRSVRVFRDASVMTASADLWDSIRGPLEESRWFVAVISPASAASPWVAREIAWWVENRGTDQLLVVLADGTCLWDTAAGDWAVDATAVPAPLRHAFDGEPRWVDATWTAGQSQLARRDGRLIELLAEIAAPVQGTTKDAIVGEELRQHRRTVRTAVTAASLLFVLTIAAVIGALIALDQRDKAETRREEALSQSLASQATDLEKSRPDLGILLAVEAWRHAHTSQAEQALIFAATLKGVLPRVISRGRPAIGIAYQSLDETFVILREDGSVERWRHGDESGWTGTGLRDSRFRTLLQLGPRVLGLSRGGTVYELDDSLHSVTRSWSVSSGERWSAISADPDGALLAVGDLRGQLRLWSVIDHTPVGPAVLAHEGGVSGVAVRGDGERVVSFGAIDNQLKTWAVTPTGLQQLGAVSLTSSGASVAYLSDNRTIAVGESNGSVQLFDADTLTLRPDFGSNGTRSLHTASVAQVIPISDGGFATVGLDGWVKRLSGVFELIGNRRPAEATPFAAALDRTTGLTVVASADGTSAVLDSSTGSSSFGKEALSQRAPVKIGDSATADRAAIVRYLSDDGSAAAVVTLRAVGKGGQWKGTVAETSRLPSVASTAALGGNDLAVADYSGKVRRYEGSRQTAVLDVPAAVESEQPVLLALSNERLLLVTRSRVAIIETSRGKLRTTHLISDPDAAEFNAVGAFPGGRRIAVSMNDGSLRLFNVETGKEVARRMTNANASGVAISPDAKLIAQADGLTGVVSIRDATTLQPAGRDLVAPGFVNDLTWLDDGGRLATGSSDGAVHYWDIPERKLLADLPHGSAIDDMFAAPQGSVVYSAGNGTVREWDLDPVRAVHAACTEAGRNLTHDEWDTYLGGESYRKTCP